MKWPYVLAASAVIASALVGYGVARSNSSGNCEADLYSSVRAERTTSPRPRLSPLAVPFVPSRPLSGDLSLHPSRTLFFQATSRPNATESIPLLEKAIQSDPAFESAYERLANAYLEIGNGADAQARASDCLNLNPRSKACHHAYIQALIEQNADSAVLLAVQDCLTAIPHDFLCLKKARTYLLARNAPDEFDEIELREYSASAGTPSALLQVAFSFWELGDRHKALEAANEACQLGKREGCLIADQFKKLPLVEQ